MDLTAEEKSLFQEIAIPDDVIALIKENVTAKLKMLNLEVFDSERNLTQSTVKVIAFLVSESESKKLIYNLRERLASKGYLAFIAKIHYAFENLEDEEELNIAGNYSQQIRDTVSNTNKHTIGIIKCKDPYELIRLIRTDAANYDLTTEDIIDKLKSWEKISAFEIFGVAYDWLELDFINLPDDIESFARDIYEFCPDTLEQGYVGPTMDENSDWGDFEHAFKNQTIDDLANYLKEHKSLFLWWD